MSSRYEIPLILSDDKLNTRETSIILLLLTLLTAFSYIIEASTSSVPSSRAIKRDKYNRPAIVYNNNYNPNKALLADLKPKYLLYAISEPLYNDRLILIVRILLKYIL